MLSFILLIFIFIFWGVRGWGGGVGVKNFDCGHFTILTHLIKTKFCNQTGRLNFPFHKTVGRAYSYNNTIRKGFLKYLLTYTKHKLNNSVKHTHNFLTIHQQLVSTASQTFDIQLLFNKILLKISFEFQVTVSCCTFCYGIVSILKKGLKEAYLWYFTHWTGGILINYPYFEK